MINNLIYILIINYFLFFDLYHKIIYHIIYYFNLIYDLYYLILLKYRIHKYYLYLYLNDFILFILYL
jgi:hypothetical protein